MPLSLLKQRGKALQNSHKALAEKGSLDTIDQPEVLADADEIGGVVPIGKNEDIREGMEMLNLDPKLVEHITAASANGDKRATLRLVSHVICS